MNATSSRYMASHKGATGPVCDTPIDAAHSFSVKYPKAKACTVRAVSEVPGSDLVTVSFKGPFWAYTLRKGEPHIAWQRA